MITVAKLKEKLREEGVSVTERRLLDWIAEGLLPHPVRHGLGRGRGVVFVWDDDERVLQQARWVYKALRLRERVESIRLPLWLIGFEVLTAEEVRRKLLERMDVSVLRQQLLAETGEGDLEDAIYVYASAHPISSRALRGVVRVKREEVAEIFLANFIFGLKRDVVRAARVISGVFGSPTENMVGWFKALRVWSLAELSEALASAGPDDVLWARVVIQRLAGLARVVLEKALPDLSQFEDSDILMLAALAVSEGLPILVKLRLDGYGGVVERILELLERVAREWLSGDGSAGEQILPLVWEWWRENGFLLRQFLNSLVRQA